ncbi:Nrg1-like zn-finger transcription factor [Mycena indigotica]|uniref:Nrg1-like zn-finger transcription factor n=1 Tax=Mycena indigotica TaxID=2126181 RepID=A0A8H6SAY8_9AGAR|nr:Nrg1-like zn-finger transcription factor [Mycena indigotica]KAF7295391.1 Nrg1-like zn-finger transcription factor [Mycena indigotica]
MPPKPPNRPPTDKQPGKHVCSVRECRRAFSTAGHLSRHTKTHTGERNHACPFPGCTTRCSRADNLQQHYRIHLSPGSRGRNGGRRVFAIAPPTKKPRLSTVERSPPPPPISPLALDMPHNDRDPDSFPTRCPSYSPPPNSPPPLEDSRLYYMRIALQHAPVKREESPPPIFMAPDPADLAAAIAAYDSASDPQGLKAEGLLRALGLAQAPPLLEDAHPNIPKIEWPPKIMPKLEDYGSSTETPELNSPLTTTEPLVIRKPISTPTSNSSSCGRMISKTRSQSFALSNAAWPSAVGSSHCPSPSPPPPAPPGMFSSLPLGVAAPLDPLPSPVTVLNHPTVSSSLPPKTKANEPPTIAPASHPQPSSSAKSGSLFVASPLALELAYATAPTPAPQRVSGSRLRGASILPPLDTGFDWRGRPATHPDDQNDTDSVLGPESEDGDTDIEPDRNGMKGNVASEMPGMEQQPVDNSELEYVEPEDGGQFHYWHGAYMVPTGDYLSPVTTEAEYHYVIAQQLEQEYPAADPDYAGQPAPSYSPLPRIRRQAATLTAERVQTARGRSVVVIHSLFFFSGDGATMAATTSPTDSSCTAAPAGAAPNPDQLESQSYAEDNFMAATYTPPLTAASSSSGESTSSGSSCAESPQTPYAEYGHYDHDSDYHPENFAACDKTTYYPTYEYYDANGCLKSTSSAVYQTEDYYANDSPVSPFPLYQRPFATNEKPAAHPEQPPTVTPGQYLHWYAGTAS